VVPPWSAGLLVAAADACPLVAEMYAHSIYQQPEIAQQQQQQQQEAQTQPLSRQQRRHQQRHQQQPQHPSSKLASSKLALALLSLVYSCAHISDHRRSDQHTWRELLLPVARLSMLWLSASAQRASDAASGQPNIAWNLVSMASTMLERAGIMADDDISEGAAGCHAYMQLTKADPPGTACLLRLLHLQLAWAVQGKHSRRKGRSAIVALLRSSSGSVRRQQLEVTRYHAQYTAALGAPRKKRNQERQPPPMMAANFVEGMHSWALMLMPHDNSSNADGSLDYAVRALLQQQLPQEFSSCDLADWHRLQATAAVPSVQQLLVILEAALLDPFTCCGPAVSLFSDATRMLRLHGCLGAAVPVLLQPVLHLLPLVVQHVLLNLEKLETGSMEEIHERFAAVMADLLEAGGWLQ
jgi:hypothetical protein